MKSQKLVLKIYEYGKETREIRVDIMSEKDGVMYNVWDVKACKKTIHSNPVIAGLDFLCARLRRQEGE